MSINRLPAAVGDINAPPALLLNITIEYACPTCHGVARKELSRSFETVAELSEALSTLSKWLDEIQSAE